MPISDTFDLRKRISTSLRWWPDKGVIGAGTYDATTRERGVEPIILGSPKARFALDLDTREHGWGLVRPGVYDMRLVPIEAPLPDPPGPDFKLAIGCRLWNPPFGEVLYETNASIALQAMVDAWRCCSTLAEGCAPVIHSVDRREIWVQAARRSFWVPVITIVDEVSRDSVPAFAARLPTVKSLPAVPDIATRRVLHEHLHYEAPTRSGTTSGHDATPQQSSTNGEMPDDPTGF
jgi:hypothetical protein